MISNFVINSMEFFELYWHSIVTPFVWLIISVLMQLLQNHSRNILTVVMNTSYVAPTKAIIAIVVYLKERKGARVGMNLRQILSKHFKSLSTNVTCVVTHADNFQCDWIPKTSFYVHVISDLHFSLFSKMFTLSTRTQTLIKKYQLSFAN